MSEFKIDFFELAFLAEACIPPRPIARTMFWQHLTDIYWEQMTKGERDHLFEWMNMNENYKRSLETNEDTKMFHARFDPDNQYMIYTEKQEEPLRAYLCGERYWIKRNTWIMEEAITKIEKL
jgi:hypothetical protein